MTPASTPLNPRITSPLILVGAFGAELMSMAHILGERGVSFGPAGATPALGAFNRKCLALFERHPDSIQPLPAKWRHRPLADALVKELQGLIESAIPIHGAWGIVGAEIPLLAPLYREALGAMSLDPTVILVPGDPAALSADDRLGSWLAHIFGADDLAPTGQLILAPTNRAGDDLWRFAERLQSWGPRDAWSTDEASNLTSNGEEFGCDHGFIARVLANLSAAEPSVVGLRLLKQEFESWREVLAEPALPGTTVGFAWHRGGHVDFVKEPFMPLDEWQTVQLRVDAPPRTTLQGLLYAQPCRVWIRRAEFLVGDSVMEARLAAGPGSTLSIQEGILRLDGAYEATQLNTFTPREAGPYVLSLEIWLEAGPQITGESMARLSERIRYRVARGAG